MKHIRIVKLASWTAAFFLLTELMFAPGLPRTSAVATESDAAAKSGTIAVIHIDSAASASGTSAEPEPESTPVTAEASAVTPDSGAISCIGDSAIRIDSAASASGTSAESESTLVTVEASAVTTNTSAISCIGDSAIRVDSAASASSTSAEPEPESTPVTAEASAVTPDSGAISCIGDSVMLGASDALRERLPGCVIDAEISRQVTAGLDIAKALSARGELGSIVLIGLGINGTFSQEIGQALIDYLGKERTIYWVTAYGRTVSWQDEVNAVIRALSAANDNVFIIDWAAAAPGHPDWFYSDGIHLQPAGQTAYADLIFRSLG